ncbi:MAG TPA: SDR family oxidoreductase [Cyclobacteriaceae bacterium]
MPTFTEGMLKNNALQGKTILITGGGTGLGKSMGEYFLELGSNIIICGRKQEVLNKTAEEWSSKFNTDVLPVSCDVRKSEDVEKLISTGLSRHKTIDVLVNNAAGNFISPTERLSYNAFNTIIDIVLKGTINCTLALGKQWINTGSPGNILNIVTTYSWTGSGYVVPSACAKAGVLAMTRSLAVEWAKYKIRTNAVAPGPFPTEGAWSRLLPGDLKEKFDPAKKIPVQRVGVHQELANLCAYLVSDYSSFVNGEVVTIDGGEWLKGAGEFNHLDQVAPEMWDMLESFRKR